MESFELEFLIKSENIPNIQGSKASLALSNLSILDEWKKPKKATYASMKVCFCNHSPYMTMPAVVLKLIKNNKLTNSSDHSRVWTANLLHVMQFPNQEYPNLPPLDKSSWSKLRYFKVELSLKQKDVLCKDDKVQRPHKDSNCESLTSSAVS